MTQAPRTSRPSRGRGRDLFHSSESERDPPWRAARRRLEEDFDARTWQFLLDFSSALQKYAFYPPGHRSLEPHLQNMLRSLRPLLGDRGRVTVTVGPDHLVVGRARTDADNPLLRGVASRLHDHHLLAVTFREGIQPEELSAALGTLSEEVLDEEEDPLGLRGPEALDRWPHVDLQALDYDPLRTARPYRDPWEPEKILRCMEERAGTEFCPDAVDAFVRMLRERDAGTAGNGDRRASLSRAARSA